MKQLIVILFLCIYNSVVYAQFTEEDVLNQKYWQYKSRFYQNFIRIDWGGDGIGIFQEYKKGNPAWYGHFEKAGYSIPAAAHHPTRNKYWWPLDPNTPFKKSYCNLNPDLSNENGALAWSEDTGCYLGLYLAVLSTEYALQIRNGAKDEAAKTLEEIYLALQAFRRLNMTANRWVERYLEVVPEFKCNDSWIADMSGFSGLAIRNDVPYSFWEEFHKPATVHSRFGKINPTASDEYGKMPEEKPGYHCADRPNAIPDIRNIYAPGQLSCQAHPLCGYEEKDCHFLYLAPNDPKKLAPEILAEKYMSQDQVIGLLLGLAFIKKFIPDDILHQSPEGPVSVVLMSKKIAKALVSNLGGPGQGFYLPPCIGKPDNYAGTNTCGYDWRYTKYGICETVNFICSEEVCKGNYFNFSSVLVQGFTLGEKPIVVVSEGKNEKRRMNYSFYHTLVALSNPKRIPLKNAIKDGREYTPWIEPYYPLLRMLLHDIPEKEMLEAGSERLFEQYPERMRRILNSYSFNGNCIPAKKRSDCFADGYPHTNLDCESDFVHHPDERTGNRITEWFPYSDDFCGNGLDYMLMYNIYKLSFK